MIAGRAVATNAIRKVVARGEPMTVVRTRKMTIRTTTEAGRLEPASSKLRGMLKNSMNSVPSWTARSLSIKSQKDPIAAVPTAPAWLQRAGLGADVMGTGAKPWGRGRRALMLTTLLSHESACASIGELTQRERCITSGHSRVAHDHATWSRKPSKLEEEGPWIRAP